MSRYLISSHKHFLDRQEFNHSLEERYNFFQFLQCSHSLISDRGTKSRHGANHIVGIVEDIESIILHLLTN